MELNKIKVLVVEDHEPDYRLVFEYLKESVNPVFQVSRAKKLSEALNIISGSQFDVILTDMDLPDSRGLNTLASICKATPQTAVVVLTGLNDFNMGVQSLHMNAQDYLVKGQLQADLLVRSVRYAIERKQAQDALVRSKEEWERTFDNVPDLIALLDNQHRIIRVNESMAQRLGIKKDQCVGLHCFEYVHGTCEAPGFCPHSRTMQDGQSHTEEVREEHLKGDFLVTTTPIFDQGKLVGSVHVARDITERKKAEEKLRWTEQRNAILSKSAAALLAAEDPQMIVDQVCQETMEFLSCQVFFNFLIISEKNRLHLNAYSGISEQEVKRIEWLDFGVAVCGCVARDGERMIAEDIGNRKDQRTDLVAGYGVRAYCCHPLLVEKNVIGTISFGTKTRDSFMEDEISMMKATADMVAIAIQRKRFEEELKKSNENLEHFAHVASHDLQEPLRSISLSLELIKLNEGDTLQEKSKEFMKYAIEAATHQQKMIRDLLSYSRIDTRGSEFKKVSLNKILENVLKSLQVLMDETKTKVQIYNLPDVFADSYQLHHVFQNLINNAIKFRNKNTNPVIQISCSSQNEMEWLISVKDNGIGVDSKYSGDIFKMFSRLHKNEYPGSGLGLAICKKIVERHGGTIWLESELNQGTTFYFTLPKIVSLHDKECPVPME